MCPSVQVLDVCSLEVFRVFVLQTRRMVERHQTVRERARIKTTTQTGLETEGWGGGGGERQGVSRIKGELQRNLFTSIKLRDSRKK